MDGNEKADETIRPDRHAGNGPATRSTPGAGLRYRLNQSRRAIFLLLGLLMVALGIIGAFLPVMPSTIFLILAAWFFGRSSPRLERWLLEHPRFGPTLRVWQEQGAVPRRAKVLACLGIALGYVLFFIGAQPDVIMGVIVAIVMAGCALYVISRPAPRTGESSSAKT
ncbi:YbaN family protein [Pelagibacterium xiamenense]|uniref:YbaN family protein n=1 Tax=Pelagibacterium xiamenense TaxID=2901140 RepID=UPI001E2B8925|nr:YbaN family protein [Pelagibacterium xiamenense]MCD7059549.1 YbaN family protein [Pelagibacterium xiamenense]